MRRSPCSRRRASSRPSQPYARRAEISTGCCSSGRGEHLSSPHARPCLSDSLHLLRLIDGEIEDQAFEGGIADVVRLLESSSNSQLIKKYSLWVVQRDAEAGIRVSQVSGCRSDLADTEQLLTREAGGPALADGDGVTDDYRKTLSELKRLDPQAAEAFLEHMVLAREPPIAELHTELVELLIGRVVGSDAEGKRAMAEVCEWGTRQFRVAIC